MLFRKKWPGALSRQKTLKSCPREAYPREACPCEACPREGGEQGQRRGIPIGVKRFIPYLII